MTFKIDAKEQFTIISPDTQHLNADLAAQLAELCRQLMQKGSRNFIVDVLQCSLVDPSFLAPFVEMSAQLYENGHSFVLTNPAEEVFGILKSEDAIDRLNCAPTLIEAIDIVNMEILERDLFGEE